MSWYSSNFWSEYLEDVPCSADEMKQAVEGALFTGVFYNHNSTRQTIAGMTGNTCTEEKGLFSFLTSHQVKGYIRHKVFPYYSAQ